MISAIAVVSAVDFSAALKTIIHRGIIGAVLKQMVCHYPSRNSGYGPVTSHENALYRIPVPIFVPFKILIVVTSCYPEP